jgi:hypothetical protein
MEALQIARPEPAAASWLGRASRAAAALLAGRLGSTAGLPLPRLDETYPRASLASPRWHGLVAVPVSDIVGTASYLPGTRRKDFLPTPGSEPADWQTRWNRLEAAARTLAPLPPIELLKAGDSYWVVDGHNRVALAKSTGQLWIDADVTELRLPSPHSPLEPAHGGTN